MNEVPVLSVAFHMIVIDHFFLVVPFVLIHKKIIWSPRPYITLICNGFMTHYVTQVIFPALLTHW